MVYMQGMDGFWRAYVILSYKLPPTATTFKLAPRGNGDSKDQI